MAQGEAISALLRADRLAPGQGFGEAAVRASLPFYGDSAAACVKTLRVAAAVRHRLVDVLQSHAQRHREPSRRRVEGERVTAA